MEYPYIAPKVSYELPTSFTLHSISLYTIYNEFQAQIQKYQELFDCLDDLDKNMRIIEPEEPKRCDIYRKIALGFHCSLHIQFNPDYSLSKGKPTNIRFFGSLTRVKDLKLKWKSYIW